MRSVAPVLQLLAAAVSLQVAACGELGNIVPSSPNLLTPTAKSKTGLRKPALISIDLQTGDLFYWPIKEGPRGKPITLSGNIGTYESYSMAANGNVVIAASYSPPEVIEYNVKTKAETTIPDAFGNPLDVAVDKQGTVYALSEHQVTVFPTGSSQPYTVACNEFSEATSVAVDNESDIFVDTYGSNTGVVEVPSGSSNCVELPLRAALGYLAGVGIDPKTDDLIVVDNPGECAGGNEGRMIIYPKPYSARTSIEHHLHAQYCAGGFRLDKSSSHIYVSDATVDASYPLIDVRSYPSGKGNAAYYDYSAYFGGFTIVPSALPN